MTSPTHPSAPSRVAVLTAFAIVYVIWGSTYLGIRFAIETLPPFTMAGLRFLTAGVLLFSFATWRHGSWPGLRAWRTAAIVGTLLLVSGNGLLSWSELYVPSGVAALIVATVPLFMVVLDTLGPRGTRPTTAVCLGLLLGMAGIAILIGPSEIGGAPIHLGGAMAILFASFSWAVGSLYSRTAPQSSSTLQNVGMQMLIGGLLLLPIGFALGERLDLAQVSTRSWLALLYLALVGGVLAYSAYVWLLRVQPAARVATYAFVNPVVAVVLGWALAGEAMGPRVLGATIAVATAVALITWQAGRGTPTQEKRPAPPAPDRDGKTAGDPALRTWRDRAA